MNGDTFGLLDTLNLHFFFCSQASLETVLIRLGYHLDNRLIHRMKRALYRYSEETQRANLGVSENTDNTTQVFVKRYSINHHGCRDKRPDHWRKYL